ncbi:MAG: 23S rRNA (uracil(1939)-C(5))-methyltransferase RlmD [Planctomycetes bacterium]|nr:23S rRNA (uracil(1939)-C(5))-methyltransferase RlmD [Planctomycetota bacterium]
MTTVLSCPHFPACSGCTAIGTPYTAQLAHKLAELQRHFAGPSLVPGEANAITQITASPNVEAYRNRVKLVPARAFRRGESSDSSASRVELGLYRASSHEVVDIPGCPIQMDGLNRAIETIRAGLNTFEIELYDEVSHTGDLRFITVRQGHATSELLVGFVTRTEQFPGGMELAQAVMQQCDGVIGVVQNINPDKGNVIFGSTNRLMVGRRYVVETVCGVRLRLGLRSFFQVNTPVAELAYGAIQRHLQLDHRTTLLDLYCGVGAIGLVTAGSVLRVIGMEAVSESIEFAREAARDNDLLNVEFRRGLVEERLPQVVTDLRRAGISAGRLAVVVNPPRKGLEHKVRRMLIQMGAIRIAYLSCSPPSLVRDLKYFLEGGYRLRYVEAFDMFPQTPQVETLAILERRPRAADRRSTPGRRLRK